MKAFFSNDNLNLKLRQRMIKCYVWSVLLYGAETWTLCYIKECSGYPAQLGRPTEAVLNRANAVRELFDTIQIRKIAYLEHVFRGDRYRVLQLIMKGKIEGSRGIGRKQMSWLKNIPDWSGIRSAEELFRLGENSPM